VVRKIDAGTGTIGVLVNDPTIANDVASITGSIARGEGTVGALVVRPELYDNLRTISEDIAVVTGALRRGEGTLGKLVLDDDIYRQIKTALNIVTRSLEELREAAPITTFTSIFFSAF
jgi:phospholipid/cholesterol/gamma-HCH transport system substrate-binding protein